MSVVGINFGNSFASIAVISNEGSAECIANEDGERQIAAAISFHGEELYIGNQATPQLVKNAANTITGFRDLLGLKFSEISSETKPSLVPSAPVIQHPAIPDTPCYSVQILVPAPAPLPTPARSTPASSRPSTQHPTPLATPRSEPLQQTRLLTPHDAAVLFIRALAQSATDFLGSAPTRAVLTAPRSFSPTQLAALEAAASEAGLQNVQLLAEDAAAAALLPSGADRTALLVDWGATHLAARVLRVRAGMALPLGVAHASSPSISEALVRYFANEFSKKSGEKLQVCPPPTPVAQRSQTKLALALPAVTRALTAQRPAQLSIESLSGGLDYSSTLRTARATLLLQASFGEVSAVIRQALEDAARNAEGGTADVSTQLAVDTILWAGGAGHWGAAGLLPLLIPGLRGAQNEDTGSPEEVLARGCAVHAKSLEGSAEDAENSEDALVRAAAAQGAHVDVRATRHAVGLLVPNPSSNDQPNGHALPGSDEVDGIYIPIVAADTPLPARRTVRFAVSHGPAFACEVWEVDEVLQISEPKPTSEDDEDAEDDADDAEDEEDEDKPLPRKTVKRACLGALVVPLAPLKNDVQTKSKSRNKSRTDATGVTVRVDVSLTGDVVVAAREGTVVDDAGDEGWVVLKVGA